ncbi:hypothetical protein [Microvirga brassicacearum]|uniref:DUF3313 domain-containing protein n=1 Tax=Microvirga brassicacearum TaxID=2580413 RepID=A0A5N3P568_9HYPH|nr:hypothetical protein [Microvirga brassicacearum]KAB0264887.1 hypothetical protein FEZ63_21380 [Microvirga brassicacearum]
MFARAAAVVLLAFALSGCITAANTLSPDQISSLRLQSVEVKIAPNARISWGDGEIAYAKTKGAAAQSAEFSADTDEGRAFVRNVISDRLRSAMLAAIGPELAGARPVKLAVRVHEVRISSAIQRVILGGDHTIQADVELLDAKTATPLLSLPSHHVLVKGGGGPLGVVLDNLVRDEPIDLVTKDYARQYRNWLLRK